MRNYQKRSCESRGSKANRGGSKRRGRRTAVWSAGWVLFLTLFLLWPLPAQGAEAPKAGIDEALKCRIELDYQDDLAGTTPIVNAEFTIYRIGTLTENGGLKSLITGIDALSDRTDARKILPAVKAAYAKKHPAGWYRERTRTNAFGRASFEALVQGVYLIEESEAAAYHAPSRPFLVAVPFTEENAWVYTAHAEPKPVPTGGLSLTKTVRSRKRQALQTAFHFVVTLEGRTDPVPVLYPDGSEGLYESGTVLSLKHGQTITFPVVPAGTSYHVTEQEADRDGFLTSSVNADGTIRHAEVREVSFLNKELPPETGDSRIGLAAAAVSALSLAAAFGLLRAARDHGRKGGQA